LSERFDLFYFNYDDKDDKYIKQHIDETLSSRDVYIRGFVLDGFPLKLKHVK